MHDTEEDKDLEVINKEIEKTLIDIHEGKIEIDEDIDSKDEKKWYMTYQFYMTAILLIVVLTKLLTMAIKFINSFN